MSVAELEQAHQWVVGVDDISYGGACGGAIVHAPDCPSGSSDVFPAGDDILGSVSSSVFSFPDLVKMDSLACMEPDILASFALHATASTSLHSQAFDLSKAPLSFAEAHAHSDASIW